MKEREKSIFTNDDLDYIAEKLAERLGLGDELEQKKALFLPDSEIARLMGLTETNVGNLRRQMRKLPSQKRWLGLNGTRVSVEGLNQFQSYRGTLEYKRERAKVEKMTKKGA